MKWLINTLAATIAGAVGWWIGAKIGIMTAFFISTIFSGFAIYYATKWVKENLP